MEKNKEARIERLNDYVRGFSGFVANLDPESLTASERAELYDVFMAIKSVAGAGRVMIETSLAG